MRDSDLLWRFREGLARAKIPLEVPSVCGKIWVVSVRFRSLSVAGGALWSGTSCEDSSPAPSASRSTAAVEVATALSTRAGTEYVSHVLQARTDMHLLATVLSVDGVGVFDTSCREHRCCAGCKAVKEEVLCCLLLCSSTGSPSSFMWDEAHGITHSIIQGEGGEQSEPALANPALRRQSPAVVHDGVTLRFIERFVRRFRRVVEPRQDADSPWKDKGV